MERQALIGALSIGALSTESGLLVLNRFILSAGVYKFPYPIATTLIQCIITYFFVMGAENVFLLLLFLMRSRDVVDSPRVDQEPLLPNDDTPRSHPLNLLRGLSPRRHGFRRSGPDKSRWMVILKALPIATVYLLKVGLGNAFMAHLPMVTYILLRIASVPLSFVFNAAIAGQTHSVFASLFAVLATASLFLTLVPFLDHVRLGDIVLGSLLSMVDALFPVMIFRACSDRRDGLVYPGDVETISEKQYTATTTGSRLSQTFGSIWPVLRHTPLLSVAISVPFLFLSGEWSKISQNSYVLDITCLWQLLLFSGLLNGALLVTTSLLVLVTSPVTTCLTAASSNSVLLAVFAFGSLTFDHWIGLTGCVIFSLLFVADQIREGTKPEQTSSRSLYTVSRTVAVILVLCVSIPTIGRLSWNHTRPPVIEGPKCEISNTQLAETTASKPSEVASIWHDGYLGPRPDVDTVADIPLILERCSEVVGGLGVDDVVNCLSFLATEQDQYLTLPGDGESRRASERNPQAPAIGSEESQKDLPSHDIQSSSTSAPSVADLGACPGPVIPFHVYWTGPASWRFELFVKAYLYTQNLPCSRLWIWLDSDTDINAVDKMLCEDPIFQHFLPLVTRGDIFLKAWHFPHRIPLPRNTIENITTPSFHPHLAGSNLEMTIADNIIQDGTGKWLLLDPTSTTFSPVQVSDAVRFIVLHLHGGIYLDMDVLLLRDMRPLLLSSPTTGETTPFAEQWVERCPESDYNTAIISLPANSSLSTYLLRGGVRMGMNFHPKTIGRMMWRDGRNEQLKMLHNALFDPLVTDLRRKGSESCTVPCHKNFESAFQRIVDEPGQEWKAYQGEQGELVEGTWPPTNRSLEHFFRGAWAYHVHNQWWKFPEPTSWMDVITRAQDGFFAGERTNAYGEMWEGPSVAAYERDTWV